MSPVAGAERFGARRTDGEKLAERRRRHLLDRIARPGCIEDLGLKMGGASLLPVQRQGQVPPGQRDFGAAARGQGLEGGKFGVADEIRDEGVGRTVIVILLCALLRDLGFLHHDDPVRDGHRLFLMVGDTECG